MLSISDISSKLSARALEIAKYLLPNGRSEGREWVVGSVAGEEGKSLKVCVEGSKVGVWCDFAGGGKPGDLIDLWVAVRACSMSEALKEIKGYLNIEDPTFARTDKKKKFKTPLKQEGVKKIPEDSPVMKYLKNVRKLTQATISAFGLEETDKVGPWEGWRAQNPYRGKWIVFPYKKDGETISIKYIQTELDKKGKKKTLVEPGCKPSLFGWQAVKSSDREVWITEGELDCCSVYQYGYPALSVPFGGGKGAKQQWVEYEWDNLQQFEVIYICMDNDEEGEMAALELIERLGRHRCRIITLPRKDANKCLQDGITKEEIDICYTNARSLDPVELKRASDFKEKTRDRFYPPDGLEPGVLSPFGKLTNKLRFRNGEVSLWTGINGHGKSTLLGQFMMHFAWQGEKICIASLEMKAEATLARIVRQLANERKPSHQLLDEAFDWLHPKFWIFDVVGAVNYSKILEVFQYAYHRYGINQFVIDSFMRCNVDEEDKKAQLDFMNHLVAFVNQYGGHIHVVAHPRKGLNEEHFVGKMDVKGSGCLTDLPWNVFSIWRNKNKERELSGESLKESKKSSAEIQAEPDGMFICDKQREGDWEGMQGLYFDKDSLRYYDSENYRAPDYLDLKKETAQEDLQFDPTAEEEEWSE